MTPPNDPSAVLKPIDPDTDDTMGQTIPITESRLFDLVRYMRGELMDARLISMGEWTWLATGATPDIPGAGSPSRQRLESYDDLRERLEAVRVDLDVAMHLLHELREYGYDGTTSDEPMYAMGETWVKDLETQIADALDHARE